MKTYTMTRAKLILAFLGLVAGCGTTPGENTATQEAPIEIKICLSSGCNSSCAEKLGVKGGQCVNNSCVCDAPTCGAIDQAPCNGNQCESGLNPSAVLGGACGACGGAGQPCCVLNNSSNPENLPACYGGTTCGEGLPVPNGYCNTCGGNGQPPCANAGSGCVDGLVAAVSSTGAQVCTSNCGAIGQQECAPPTGCTQPSAVLNTTTYQCTENPACGHAEQGCCNQGSVFQNPSATTDICYPGQGECSYIDYGIAGLSSWVCWN
jgi:hypothetical protein